MASISFLLLAAALGVLMVHHGGVSGHPRYSGWRSVRADTDSDDGLIRVRRQLLLPDDPSANTGSIDDLIILGPNDLSENPAGGKQPSFGNGHQASFGGGNQPSFGGGNQASFGGGNQASFGGGNQPFFGTASRVPQLEVPPEITRTFIPTDPRFGPSTEVITVGRIPQTAFPVSDIFASTITIQIVSTTTSSHFTVLTSTVTIGVTGHVVPSTVTQVGECKQPPVTYYVRIPADIITATVYRTNSQLRKTLVDKATPSVSYFDKTLDHGNRVTRTQYYKTDRSNLANVKLQVSSFTTPCSRRSRPMQVEEYTTGFLENGGPLPDASNIQVTESGHRTTALPVKFVNEHRSRQDLKTIHKRSANVFVDECGRTKINY